MDREPFAEALRDGYHSRRFVLGVLVIAVLVVGGTAWLLLGLSRLVGAVAVAAGGLAMLRLLVDRWAVDQGRPTLRDWRPGRRVYVVAPVYLSAACCSLLSFLATPIRSSEWASCC